MTASQTRTLVLGTSNQHKLEELRHALPGWTIKALERDDFPPEVGATYVENARAKARHTRLHAPAASWVAGEDSGIEVRALGGRPGIESARWAADGVSALLAALERESDRRARYVCSIVAVAPDGAEISVEGTLEGQIVVGEPRGVEGFGYDPVFVPAGETHTVAELGGLWKHANSHRAQAAAALAEALSAI